MKSEWSKVASWRLVVVLEGLALCAIAWLEGSALARTVSL